MSADNQQERPNYRLHCIMNILDFGYGENLTHAKYDFHASDDKDARKKTQAWIDKYHENIKKQGKILGQKIDAVYFWEVKLTGLERLVFVKEVEETIPIPLQENITSSVSG